MFALALLGAALPAPKQSQIFEPHVGPEPITPVPEPPALDPRRLRLGEQLFRDQRLSRDAARSCWSCHDTQTNGASANAHDLAPQGEPLALNTLTIFNASLNFRLNWEGNFRSLEQEAASAFANPTIMNLNIEEAAGRLRADAKIVSQFRDAYGGEPNAGTLLDAINTYERSLTTPGSRFDRWLAGDAGAITLQELGGYQLFKSLGCVSCHQGVNLGGNLFQRHGIFRPLGSPEPQFVRVPSLRNVATTPPYFHDGSAATLSEAVKAMGTAQLDRTLTNQQVTVLVAFLGTLTGTYRGQPVMPAAAPETGRVVP